MYCDTKNLLKRGTKHIESISRNEKSVKTWN